MRIVRRVFLTLLVVVLVSVATFTVLSKFFGLRVAAWGAGYKPQFYCFSPEEHYSGLEKNRAEQKSASPAPAAVPDPAPAAAPTAVPGVSPAGDPPPAKEKTAGTTAPHAGAPPYWTNFRGPNRDGVHDETPVLTSCPPKDPNGPGSNRSADRKSTRLNSSHRCIS